MLVAACTKMTMSAAEEERCRVLLAKLKEAIDKRGVLLDKLGKVMDETVSSLATSTPLLVCGAADSTPNSTATNKVPAMANAAPSANTTLTDQAPTRCSTMCPDHSIDMPLSDCTTAVAPTSSSTIATLEIGNTFIANTVLVKSTECSKECEEQAVDTDHCVAAAGICAVASTNCLMECPRLVAGDSGVTNLIIVGSVTRIMGLQLKPPWPPPQGPKTVLKLFHKQTQNIMMKISGEPRRLRTLSVCLTNASTGQPFISTLEFRQFNGSIYYTTDEAQFFLTLSSKINFGVESNESVRGSQDANIMASSVPFNFESGGSVHSLPKLRLNPYSWSKVSSVIYLHSPAGVGLSYSKNVSDYQTGDLKTAADSHTFLLKWFQRYLEFLSNPFYIAGESYAGVYAPTLSHEVVKGIQGGVKPTINFKGYMVGNGVCDTVFDGNALVPFAHGMGLISDDIYQEASTACQGNYWNASTAKCEKALSKVDTEINELNIHDILLSPQDDDFDESAHVPIQLALIFAHTEKFPDEPLLLNAKSVRGIKSENLATLKEKIDQEASENLGMAMVYTLVTSAKEWLSEKYGQNVGDEKPVETEETEEEVIVPHGEAVTVESFLAWREIELQLLPIANASLYIQGNDVKAYLGTSPAAKPKFWLAFSVSVPPLGFKTDFVSSGKKSALSSMSTLHSSQGSKNSNMQVGQGHLKLQYDAARALSLHSDRKNLVEANVEQKYKYYIGQNRNGSDPQAFGAYIFSPNGIVPIKTDGQGPLTILHGHLFDPTMKSKPCFCIVLPGNGKPWKCLQFGSDGYGKRVDWTRLGIASEVVDTIEIYTPPLGVMSGRNGSSLTSMHRRQSSMLLIESDSWSSKMHVPLHIRLLLMKHKFCLKLALLATLPECYRGLNGRVVYIDTESKFSSWGLVEIGEKSFPQIFRQEGLAQKMAGRILVMRPTSLSDFTKSLEQMKVTLLQDDVKLLIVDSMATLMSSSMAEFSRIPVVVTNQVLSQSNDEGYHYSLEVEKKDDSNSAERLESDKLKVKNAVDSLITKPLKASILAACLFQALGTRESNEEKRDDSGSLHELLLGKNMLVVDDNKLPWDPGGQTSMESAWGQAEFHRGKNVMNLGCRAEQH